MRQPEPSLRRSVWRAERALGCSRTRRLFLPFGSSGVSVNRDRTKLTPETDFAVERPPEFLRESFRERHVARESFCRARHFHRHASGACWPSLRAALLAVLSGDELAELSRSELVRREWRVEPESWTHELLRGPSAEAVVRARCLVSEVRDGLWRIRT